MLLGAKILIQKSSELMLAVCSYHSDFDQELIESYMDKKGINHTTNGYMCFAFAVKQVYVSNKLNRGIVRGIKLA